ncbi:cytochrome d ubiquinol oxidase subunit II [Streptomyces sp. 2A115]|uniref:cytochrome d ubiquinol oxidase subunit II n=1 Tax=Streptomyces sp. 2A115 TaxID=3457439 RepID=UPI003FD4E59F
MTIQTAWLGLFGLLFIGYLIMDGRTIGVGLVLPLLGRDTAKRSAVVHAVGPYFLANEVWIIAALGLLVGGFPIFEGTMLSGLFPYFIPFVAAMGLRGVSFHFRLRESAPGWRRLWETVLTFACLVQAIAWGFIGSLMFRALPLGDDEVLRVPADLLAEPFTLACVPASVAVFALHGTNFAAARLEGPLSDRAAALGKKLGPAALLTVLLSVVAGVFDDGVKDAVGNSGLVIGLVVLGVAGTVASDVFNHNGRPRFAFIGSSLVLLSAALVVGAGRLPYLIVSSHGERQSMTVTEGAAEASVLHPLFWVVLVLLPVLMAAQFMTWRIARGRVREGSVGYF